MAMALLLSEDIKLVSLIGKAGTGKTIIALASAITQLHDPYEQIVLSKPIVDMGNSLGFLGDMTKDNLIELFLTILTRSSLLKRPLVKTEPNKASLNINSGDSTT